MVLQKRGSDATLSQNGSPSLVGNPKLASGREAAVPLDEGLYLPIHESGRMALVTLASVALNKDKDLRFECMQ